MSKVYKVILYLILLIVLTGGISMADKAKESASFRHEREWPVILKVAGDYKLTAKETIVLLAMRDVEMGGRGIEFGEMPAKGTDLETQAKWAAGGIRENKKRYNILMTTGIWKGPRRTIVLGEGKDEKGITYVKPDIDFITFMGSYGAQGFGRTPIHAPELNKEHIEVNKNFVPNMQKTVEKITKQFTEKGVDYGKELR